MEFIPRAAQIDAAEAARRRSIREAGVAAVAAALGMAEGAGPHGSVQASSRTSHDAERDARRPLPKAA